VSGVVERLWDRPSGNPLVHLLLSPLWLLSLLFGLFARRRVKRAHPLRVQAKVVSVGNLTAGGAGKTPVTIHLAKLLLAAGKEPYVLSRGHGREQPERDRVVSDGQQVLTVDVRESGDEPLLIARACPGAAVIVARDRASAARSAVERNGAATILLDDGFQHVSLARDLDIVVLDAASPFGNGYLLPRGPLREPKEALGRAGLICISKVDQASEAEVASLEDEVRRFSQAPLVRSAYRVADVLDDEWKTMGPGALGGKRVLLVCGIARPESFRRTLASLGATIVAERVFADHHWFTASELEAAKLEAQRLGVDAIAMTEKDALRLPGPARRGPFAIVRVEVEIRSGADALATALAGA
jgi:tetraacyldisaccharide 4'-kinase